MGQPPVEGDLEGAGGRRSTRRAGGAGGRAGRQAHHPGRHGRGELVQHAAPRCRTRSGPRPTRWRPASGARRACRRPPTPRRPGRRRRRGPARRPPGRPRRVGGPPLATVAGGRSGPRRSRATMSSVVVLLMVTSVARPGAAAAGPARTFWRAAVLAAPDDRRHLGVRPVEQVALDHRRALLGWQLPHGRPQVAVEPQVVGRGRGPRAGRPPAGGRRPARRAWSTTLRWAIVNSQPRRLSAWAQAGVGRSAEITVSWKQSAPSWGPTEATRKRWRSAACSSSSVWKGGSVTAMSTPATAAP